MVQRTTGVRASGSRVAKQEILVLFLCCFITFIIQNLCSGIHVEWPVYGRFVHVNKQVSVHSTLLEDITTRWAMISNRPWGKR